MDVEENVARVASRDLPSFMTPALTSPSELFAGRRCIHAGTAIVPFQMSPPRPRLQCVASPFPASKRSAITFHFNTNHKGFAAHPND